MAVALPCLVAGTFYGLAVRPLLDDGDEARERWYVAITALDATVQRSRAITDGSLGNAMVCSRWIEQRVPTAAAPAAFLERLQELGAELGIALFEYDYGTSQGIGDTGYRADPIEVRVVAPYAAVGALWERIERMDRAIAWRTLRTRRYGDRVAATFTVELFSRSAPGVEGDEPAGGTQ
ncbi:MAG: hypothetical protein PVF51_01155 [Nitrospirota bacterium]